LTDTEPPNIHGTDILVLGSGIAGLFYAIEAATHGRVLVITKKEDTEGNTNYAQGGIAAVIDPADSFAAHVEDTLRAGAGLSDPAAVELVVREGPESVRRLIAHGVAFSYDEGQLSLAREGGHSARRIVRAADATGRAIEAGLLGAAARAGVEIHEHVFALDLWMAHGRCVGVIAVDRESGEIVPIRARVTMLATGGCGQVYHTTTNPAIATGDGLAMAFRAGAPVANLEFVQFHPTALWPVEPRPFLISEAVRGEGALLRGPDGEPFMAAFDARADLASRDVVARAIDAVMKRTGAEHVWLDATTIDAARFAERFPTILATCRARGLDPTREWIPVVPAAHYMCGGVGTDLDARTSLPGLLAAGEVAHTGVHGANRLASNSLLEAVVFAARAARATARLLEEPMPSAEPPRRTARLPGETGLIEAEIRETMWQGAGIVRTDEGLAEAARRIEALAERVPRSPVDAAAAEAANLWLVARLIVASAILRKESRGLHFNASHPGPDPAFERDTIVIPDHFQEPSG
jgi:L-aspartate oxidase